MNTCSYEIKRGGGLLEKFDASIEDIKCNVIHEEVVEDVSGKMIEIEKIKELASFFKVFGDSTRLRILYALSLSEMCVCDIAAVLGISQSAVSHQLKMLRQMRLVKYRRDGKVIYYSHDDDHITEIFKQGLEHINE